MKALKKWSPFGLNTIFVTLNGDIGYQATGLFPKRAQNVIQGVYAKDGTRKENLWLGVLTSDDLPSLINPDQGYIVNTNNLIARGSQNPHGLSYAVSFNHRAVRISERLEELIKKASQGKKIVVRDMQEL